MDWPQTERPLVRCHRIDRFHGARSHLNMTLRRSVAVVVLTLVAGTQLFSAAAAAPKAQRWQVGTPIVTYWCGPQMNDSTATQMKEGGFNMVWCAEKELDVRTSTWIVRALPVEPEALISVVCFLVSVIFFFGSPAAPCWRRR